MHRDEPQVKACRWQRHKREILTPFIKAPPPSGDAQHAIRPVPQERFPVMTVCCESWIAVASPWSE